jgi:hypothetical protein
MRLTKLVASKQLFTTDGLGSDIACQYESEPRIMANYSFS